MFPAIKPWPMTPRSPPSSCSFSWGGATSVGNTSNPCCCHLHHCRCQLPHHYSRYLQDLLYLFLQKPSLQLFWVKWPSRSLQNHPKLETCSLSLLGVSKNHSNFEMHPSEHQLLLSCRLEYKSTANILGNSPLALHFFPKF
jgi:hypothetical protein